MLETSERRALIASRRASLRLNTSVSLKRANLHNAPALGRRSPRLKRRGLIEASQASASACGTGSPPRLKRRGLIEAAHRGFYHQPRYGRPALSLDMMEPFRPLVADSCVIQAINNGEVRPSDFITVAGSVALTDDGRKRFISTFERRLNHEITHPLFGYRVSYRRLFELQARLLARHLLGELTEFPNFTTR